MFQEYCEKRVFELFLPYRIPYKNAMQFMIAEIGAVYDGRLKREGIKPERPFTADEAIRQVIAIFEGFVDGYEGLFNDYWPDEVIQKLIEESVHSFIEQYGEPYKSYFPEQ